MSRLFRFNTLLWVLLGVISSQNIALSDTVSLDSDYVAGQALSVDKLNNDRHSLTDGVNNIRGVYAGGVQSSGQIKADTIGEENLADDSNPRIRTGEGAACPDFVVSGLLPSNSASLVGSVPAGIAYPDGYRIEKTSSTAKVFTASKWTYVYLLTSGSMSYSETTIGATAPTAPANSAVLARVSTDSSTINDVTDLRRTSCSNGPFSAISDAPNEATLSDLFSVGVDNRRFSPAGRTPEGYIRGLWVSLDATTTQFIVTKGSAYINGKYRFISQDATIPQTADSPTDATSGVDSAPVVSDTTYYVYAVADQVESDALSITYSTSATAPAGTTNHRLIGRIGTDSNTRFASESSVFTAHAYSDRESIGGWVNFKGTGVVQVNNSYNVSSLTDHGTSDYTVTWDKDFSNANYSVVCSNKQNSSGNVPTTCGMSGTSSNPAVGSVRIYSGTDSNGNPIDSEITNVIAIGDQK